MSGVYDRLHQKLELQKREEGISPMELADLPANLRSIMRLMLREIELTFEDIAEHVGKMPDKDKMTTEELQKALDHLTNHYWLIRRGEGKRIRYEVNLRRKTGSGLTNIWSALNDRIGKAQGKEKDEGG